MCSLEPIPFMLEPMKDPKLVALVSEVRKAPGIHNYIKDVCIHSPAEVLALTRQFYTFINETVVNYVLEDNPEFTFVIDDSYARSINIVLKNGKITIDYMSTYDLQSLSKSLKVDHEFPLKKGDYVVLTIVCQMIDNTPCEDFRKCTSMGMLQFELNGVHLGDMHIQHLNLYPLFTYLKIIGLGHRTSTRELHWVTNHIIDSISYGKPFLLPKYKQISLCARSCYLWAGDSAVITGKFKKITAAYNGILVGVKSSTGVEMDVKDLVRYKDYPGAVTFFMSVTANATIISTEDEVVVCTKVNAGKRVLVPVVHNLDVDNFETHVMTWPDDEWL